MAYWPESTTMCIVGSQIVYSIINYSYALISNVTHARIRSLLEYLEDLEKSEQIQIQPSVPLILQQVLTP